MTYESDYLIHYGIKNQRWGERRYQNPDGTLTTEGKERYRKDGVDEKSRPKNPGIRKDGYNKNSSANTNNRVRNDINRASVFAKGIIRKNSKIEGGRDWKPSDADKLSDKELNERNSRLQREQQYKNLTKTKSQKFWEDVGKAVKAILINTAVTALSEFVKSKYSDAFKRADEWKNTRGKELFNTALSSISESNERRKQRWLI